MIEELSARLRRLREQNNLSAYDVSRKLGVAASTYRDWESGRQIKGEPYLRLAEIFKVTLSEILIGQDAGTESLRKDLGELEAIIRRMRLKL